MEFGFDCAYKNCYAVFMHMPSLNWLWGNFTKFTTLVQLETKMNWLDFEVKDQVTTRSHWSKIYFCLVRTGFSL